MRPPPAPPTGMSWGACHGAAGTQCSAESGPPGKWVKNSANTTWHMAGSLAQGRIDQLGNIGFKWAMKEGSPMVPWDTRFNELIQYKAEHGDCNVPARQGQLGNWVSKQRYEYKQRQLSKARQDRLESIGFEFSLKSDATVRTDQLTVGESSNDEFFGEDDSYVNECRSRGPPAPLPETVYGSQMSAPLRVPLSGEIEPHYPWMD